MSELHAVRGEVRDEVTHGARGGGDPQLDQVADDAALIATELVTNAIRHGRPPVLVLLLRDDARFLLSVGDRARGSAPRLAGTRPAGKGGFGLHIVRRLSRDLGWFRTGAAKVVWAEVGPARFTGRHGLPG
ncbi:ATP-binding protein [Cellulomonas terrae]|uniref:ATP-binding protein n=1 Tax=Cellulomonas terrae TaxID=311234 RepID=UPI0016498AF7|nr:ATP-binding protein [Cellulomonas terrae]